MRPSTTRCALAAAAIALIAASPARARPASASQGPFGAQASSTQGGAGVAFDPARALAEARAALEEQRYGEALGRARAALAAPSVSARERAAALEITAVVYLIEGRPAEARAPLFELYSLAPAFQLEDPSLPPRVTEAFEAEAKLRRARAVEVSLGRPGRVRAGSAVEIVAGGETASVKLECRRALSGPFAPVPVTTEGDRHRVSVDAWARGAPKAAVASAVRYCHAVALDVEGLPIGRLGTKAAPFEVRPAPAIEGPSAPPRGPQAAPITSAWWFWASVAGVVVAGATVAIVAAQPGDPAPPVADVTATAKVMAWTW